MKCVGRDASAGCQSAARDIETVILPDSQDTELYFADPNDDDNTWVVSVTTRTGHACAIEAGLFLDCVELWLSGGQMCRVCTLVCGTSLIQYRSGRMKVCKNSCRRHAWGRRPMG